MDTTGDSAAVGAIRTYSLEEVAAAHLPAELKDPVRWLSMRLNRGELRGSRLGRYWRMSEADVQFMLDLYSNSANVAERANVAGAPPNPVGAANTSVADGLSPRARRRLRTAR